MGVADDYKLSFYEEVSIISKGNNQVGSQVYLVRDTRDDRLYVKKLLKVSEENVYQTIMNYEIKYPGKGKLIGIPRIFALVKQDEALVVVEEYVNHPTLRKVIETEELSPKELIVIFKEICRVMEPLHNLIPPVIHRDIKPDNILVNMDAVRGLSQEPKVYVIDWNAAREYSYIKDKDTRLMGTFEFAAPEQLGYGQSDVRTDIFGVGATLEYCISQLENRSKESTNGLAWNGLKAIAKKAKSLAPNDRYSLDRHMVEAFDKLAVANTGATGRGANTSGKDNGANASNTGPGADVSGVGQGVGSQQTGHKGKLDFTLPGFRTRTLWKMLVAILGYYMIFVLAVDTKLNDYTGGLLIYSKVIYFILFLCHVFWFCNYLGIQDKFQWTKSKNIGLRVLAHTIAFFIMWTVWAIFNDMPNMLGLV